MLEHRWARTVDRAIKLSALYREIFTLLRYRLRRPSKFTRSMLFVLPYGKSGTSVYPHLSNDLAPEFSSNALFVFTRLSGVPAFTKTSLDHYVQRHRNWSRAYYTFYAQIVKCRGSVYRFLGTHDVLSDVDIEASNLRAVNDSGRGWPMADRFGRPIECV